MKEVVSRTEGCFVPVDQGCSRFLTAFAFVRGRYGLRISVVGCMELIEFDGSPDLVRGFIDFRNEKIAVIDPRIMQDSKSTPIDSQTCIVIVEPEIGQSRVKIGVLVGDLSEVLNIASYKMDSEDICNHSVNIEFILKIGRESDAQELVQNISLSLNIHNVQSNYYSCTAGPQL